MTLKQPFTLEKNMMPILENLHFLGFLATWQAPIIGAFTHPPSSSYLRDVTHDQLEGY